MRDIKLFKAPSKMGSKRVQVFLLLLLVAGTTSSAIPIWEFLTYEEKMGRLMYILVHLVERYCKVSPSTDCRKVMTLYGVSNLLNHDGHSLDLLDPDQRNGSRLIWQAAMKSQYKYPLEKVFDQDSKMGVASSGFWTVKDEAPRVVVPAPKFLGRY